MIFTERKLVADVPGTTPGQLRLMWAGANRDGRFVALFAVKSVEEAIELVHVLAAEQVDDKDVEYNMNDLQVWEDGDWTTFYDKEGDDLDAIMEAKDGEDFKLPQPPKVKYKAKPNGNRMEWTYRLDTKRLHQQLEDSGDFQKFATGVSNAIGQLIEKNPELANDVRLQWLRTEFHVLGCEDGYVTTDYDRTWQGLLDWADFGKLCWVIQM